MLDETGLKKFELYAQATLSSARIVEEFKQQIMTLINELGFSDFDYSQVNNMDDINYTFGSTPKSLIESYDNALFYRQDIVLEYVISNAIPVYQSALYEYIACSPFGFERHNQNLSIRQLMDDYGYHDAYVIPLRIKDLPGKAALSILSKGLSHDNFRCQVEQSRLELLRLSSIIQTVAAKKFPHIFKWNQKTKNSVLTKRQIQILDTLAKKAKTSQQVADHLNISIRTVNKHVEQAKESLGALSTANAIYIAIRDDLISVDA